VRELRSGHTDWFQVNQCTSDAAQQGYLKVFATKPSSLLQHINCPILWHQSRKFNTGTIAAHVRSSQLHATIAPRLAAVSVITSRKTASWFQNYPDNNGDNNKISFYHQLLHI
jgi:hypothetical protein